MSDDSRAGAPGGGEATSWWTITGETAGERIRNGLPQLLVISVLVWVGTVATYNLLLRVLDPYTATASVLLAALYVGLRLRRWLAPNDGSEETAEPSDAA